MPRCPLRPPRRCAVRRARPSSRPRPSPTYARTQVRPRSQTSSRVLRACYGGPRADPQGAFGRADAARAFGGRLRAQRQAASRRRRRRALGAARGVRRDRGQADAPASGGPEGVDHILVDAMSLKDLECPVSKLVNSDTCSRPTTGPLQGPDDGAAQPRGRPAAELGRPAAARLRGRGYARRRLPGALTFTPALFLRAPFVRPPTKETARQCGLRKEPPGQRVRLRVRRLRCRGEWTHFLPCCAAFARPPRK
jgi:hypothetical protein